MKPNQSCKTCAHCVCGNNLNLQHGECRRELRSQMLVMPNALGQPAVRSYSYYPEVQLKDRGCSQYTPALEVCDA